MKCPICNSECYRDYDSELDYNNIIIFRCFNEYIKHSYCYHEYDYFPNGDPFINEILFFNGYTIHNNKLHDYCKIFLYSELTEHINTAKPTFYFKYMKNLHSYLKFTQKQFLDKLNLLQLLT